MAFMFERLVVYQRAVDLADELMRSTADTPRGMFGRREADEFCAELEEIARMIAGLIKGLDPPPNP